MDRRQFLKTTVTAAAAASVGAPAFAQQKMVLKAADVHPLGYPTVEAVVRMGKKLEEATKGRLSIQMYPSMQLGGEKEMIEQAQVGALQICRISLGPLGPLVPEMNVFMLPFVFTGVEQERKVVDGPLGQEMIDKLNNHPTAGLIGLAWMDSGVRNVYNEKRPIKTLADLKGLKIRMMGNPMFIDTMNALGGNGVGLGMDQLANALQTGVVDGAENNEPTYASEQHYRYAKYYSYTGHLIIPEILVFSKRSWQGLSKEDQDLMKKLGREAQMEERALWIEREKQAIAKMKENGTVFSEVSPEDKKAMQAAVKPVWDKYGKPLEAMIKKIQEVK